MSTSVRTHKAVSIIQQAQNEEEAFVIWPIQICCICENPYTRLVVRSGAYKNDQDSDEESWHRKVHLNTG